MLFDFCCSVLSHQSVSSLSHLLALSVTHTHTTNSLQRWSLSIGTELRGYHALSGPRLTAGYRLVICN